MLKIAFIVLFVRPLVLIGLGLNIINRERLPTQGPMVIAANHNSHLDTLVLLSLFPLAMVHKVRPVAAADYFLANKFMAWLSLKVLGIIPIHRSPNPAERHSVFDQCHKALQNGDILLIFPEGSRGKPEVMSEIKKGIYHLVKSHSDCPVLPVVMRGLGLSLPKGTAMLVPFNCDVVLGEPIKRFNDADDFILTMSKNYAKLANECIVTHAD